MHYYTPANIFVLIKRYLHVVSASTQYGLSYLSLRIFPQITLEKIQHERATADLPPFVQRLIAYCFAGKPPYPMVAPGLFAHLRRRGVQIWFIGINTEADLDIAVRAGATGVLTDKIHWLQKTIREKNIVFKKID